MVGFWGVEMAHLSCRMVHLNAGRLCTADVWWSLPLFHHVTPMYLWLILYFADGLHVELGNWNFIFLELLCSVLCGHINEKQELPFCLCISRYLVLSSFDLWRASIISFNFYLFTWAAYLVTFRIEMTWIRVSCCLVCACISWFTCCLISHISLVVAVPVKPFLCTS